MVIQTNTPLRRSFRIRSRSIIKRRTPITKDSASRSIATIATTTSPLRRPSLQLEQNNTMDFDPPSSPRQGRAAQQGQQYVRRRSSSSRRASGDSGQSQRRRSTVDSLPMSIDSPSTSARQTLSRNDSSISSSGRQRSDPLFRPPIEPLDSQQQLRSASEHTIQSSSSPNNAPSSSNSSLQTADTGGGGGGPIRRTSMSDIEQASCRTQIKEIMKDGRLSQLEKRRSIQYLMDGRRRSTMDGTNPYLQAKAAAAAKEHRESIRRSSSFDNDTTDGNTNNGNAEPESADSLRESLRNSFRSNEGPLDMSTTDDFAYGGGGIDNYKDDEDEDDCLDMSVSMGDSNNTPAAAAVAAWRAFHGENNNQKEDPDELIEVPNHDPQAAAAIARAHQDTTTEYYTAKHPYNATCTKVPAVAAQDPKMNNKQVKDKLRTMQLNKRAIETAPPCTHYERNCHIVSPCCGATFGCRICHDDCPILPPMLVNKSDMMEMGGDSKEKGIPRRATLPSSFEASLAPPEHHNVDRFAIKEIICRECFTKQSSKTNKCINCHIQLGEYHCAICNLWMSNEERPYHCPDCGFCRVGGGENFRHCQDCGMCIDKQLFAGHNCKVGKYMSNCPVCQEDLFSSRDASHELPCGHAIHWHCFRELASHDSRCPMCKKTAETHERMKPTWDAMAMGIALQPVPPELCKVVTIKCNDCEKVQPNRSWHFLGVQCQDCESFNTVVESIEFIGQEAHEFLLRQDPTAAAAASASNNASERSGQSAQSGGSSSRSRQRPRRRRASMAAVPGENPPPPFARR